MYLTLVEGRDKDNMSHRSDKGKVAAEDNIGHGTNDSSACDEYCISLNYEIRKNHSRDDQNIWHAPGMFSHEYTSSTLIGPCAFQLTAVPPRSSSKLGSKFT